MSTWTRERHEAARARCGAATEGPWAPWLDQDGADHMNGLLMVGNADAVIPDGTWWVEGIDVNPIAHTYTPEDRKFIAHARTDIPALLDEIERHRPDLTGPAPEDRDEKVARFARRLWDAAIEVSEGDTTPIPAFEDMTTRERDALAAITDSVVSAITVLLSSRQPAPEENL